LHKNHQTYQHFACKFQGIDILDKTTMTQAGGIGIESFNGPLLGLDLLVFGALRLAVLQARASELYKQANFTSPQDVSGFSVSWQ